MKYEGAYLTDGKSLNNWDVFTHEHPEKILDESNGDVAVDQYHRFMEDVDLMISLGVKSYRFSISWSRVLPRGRFGGINYSGIKFYNIVIDALTSRGIKPFVTLNHMDYPQEFENRFQGWLSPEMQILDPVIYGTYPKEMVNILGPALPRISTNEANNLKNSKVDFMGINHYTSYFIRDCLVSACNTGSGAFKADGFSLKLDRIGNVTIGELTDVKWQHTDPEGFRKMLDYLKNRHPEIPIFITENGFGDLQKPETTIKELHDTKRIQYMSGYLEALQAAIGME
ncbi:hypothetical protein Bca52824_069336 [Brassica carinata]|uniref:thioglucosidase n=1 Tax=Brassica carinata TaxID=52824 RepID=A0A8X7Q3W4_BRACI|nr:hypothetical protein Bca52824_069336 [Brassica carinata]